MKLGLPVPTFFKIHSTQDIKELRDKGTLGTFGDESSQSGSYNLCMWIMSWLSIDGLSSGIKIDWLINLLCTCSQCIEEFLLLISYRPFLFAAFDRVTLCHTYSAFRHLPGRSLFPEADERLLGGQGVLHQDPAQQGTGVVLKKEFTTLLYVCSLIYFMLGIFF